MNFGPLSIEGEESNGYLNRNLERNDKRGTEGPFDSSNTVEKDLSRENEYNNDSSQKETESKRERKSRWGESDQNTDKISEPEATQTTAPYDEHLNSNAPENDVSAQQEQISQPGLATGISDVLVESNVSNDYETEGSSKLSADLVAMDDAQSFTYSQNTNQESIIDNARE